MVNNLKIFIYVEVISEHHLRIENKRTIQEGDFERILNSNGLGIVIAIQIKNSIL